MDTLTYRNVMTIAGSDSGGGAGIQADIKTITALGCFATTAITAITAQNTLGVQKIIPLTIDDVSAQINAICEDIIPTTVKVGMLHNIPLASLVSETMTQLEHVPFVLDPVMVAASGDTLIQNDTIEYLKSELFPKAAIITPNLEEGSLITNHKINSLKDMEVAAEAIMNLNVKSLLLKGAGLEGNDTISLFYDQYGHKMIIQKPKIDTHNTHGAGCTLSSAIASYLALGFNLTEAVVKAQDFVYQAIQSSANVVFGNGNGPLNHSFDPQKMSLK